MQDQVEADRREAVGAPCGLYIKQINDALEKHANRTLAERGLTIAQWRVLALLSETPDGRYSFKDLERLLSVSQAATVGVIHRLEDKGFIETCADDNDKRVRYVRITPAGVDVCHSSRPDADEVDGLFSTFLTSSEYQTFVALLEKVSNALSITQTSEKGDVTTRSQA